MKAQRKSLISDEFVEFFLNMKYAKKSDVFYMSHIYEVNIGKKK